MLQVVDGEQLDFHRVEDDRSGVYPHGNCDVESVRNADAWPPDCAQAFKEAVYRARGKFDIAWS